MKTSLARHFLLCILTSSVEFLSSCLQLSKFSKYIFFVSLYEAHFPEDETYLLRRSPHLLLFSDSI